MKIKSLSLIFALVGILFAMIPSGAQPSVVWENPFGGETWEQSSRIVRDTQGNVYVLGQVYNEETFADILVVKYDPAGQLLWSQQFDTGLENDEFGFDLKVDSAGNVYVAGVAHVGFSYDDVDLLLIKYDASGDLAWFRLYNGPENTYDAGFALALDPAGDAIVTGSSQTRVTLFGLELVQDEFLTQKYDSDGTLMWTRSYAGPQGDGGRATTITTDTEGNVYVAGGAVIYADFGGFDIITLKYAPDGMPLWTARYESRSSSIIEPELGLNGPAQQISVDAQGNVYVLGEASLESYSPGYDTDVVVLKYNPAGVLQWKQVMGTQGEELARNLVLDASGKVYVAADSRPFNPRGYDDRLDAQVYALDSDGTRLWNWTFNGPDDGEDGNTQVVLDGSGELYAAFFTQTIGTYDMGVVKFTVNGVPEWLYRYDSPNQEDDIFQSVISDGSDGLYFALWTQGLAYPNLLTVKMRTSGGTQSPPVLSLTIDPAQIKPLRSEFGFEPSVEGTVTLSQPAPAGGAVVRLSSNHPALDVPPFVIIGSGQLASTFTAKVNGVDADTLVTVRAEGGGAADNATVTVLAAALREFALQNQEVIGGTGDGWGNASTFGMVFLDAWAGPEGGEVTLLTDRPDVVTIPESIVIGPNDDWNAFAIQTTGVSEATDVNILATYKGATLQQTLRVLPARIAYVTLFDSNRSNYLPGGVPVTGQVILEGIAPPEGLTIDLVSDNPHLIVPATVTVAGGQRTANFQAQTLPTDEYALNVTVTASHGDNQATGTLTLHLPILRQVKITPEAVAGGTSAEGTVILDGPAPEEGILISLESDNAAAAVVTEVTVPAGATSVTFPITTTTVEQGVRAKITARAFGSASAFLTVVPASEIPDTVAIQSVGYSSSRRRPNRLNVSATSTSFVATLRVYDADTGGLLGTLSNLGNGRYSGSLFVTPKPARITVRSTLGGAATEIVP